MNEPKTLQEVYQQVLRPRYRKYSRRHYTEVRQTRLTLWAVADALEKAGHIDAWLLVRSLEQPVDRALDRMTGLGQKATRVEGK